MILPCALATVVHGIWLKRLHSDCSLTLSTHCFCNGWYLSRYPGSVHHVTSPKIIRKCVEPRSNILWLKKIVWVTGVLRRTVVGQKTKENEGQTMDFKQEKRKWELDRKVDLTRQTKIVMASQILAQWLTSAGQSACFKSPKKVVVYHNRIFPLQ